MAHQHQQLVFTAGNRREGLGHLRRLTAAFRAADADHDVKQGDALNNGGCR